MPSREELVRRLDEGFAELSALVAALPPTALQPASGGWGAFEVLAHIAGWHDSAAARLRQIALGEEPTPPGDADALNARFVEERRGLAPEGLLAEVEASFVRLRQAALALSEEQYKPESYAYFIVDANGPAHYLEHLAELRG